VVPVTCGHGVALEKGFCKSTIHSRLWKRGKVDCKAKGGAGGFLEVLSSASA